jgi:hypothetical protein
MDMNEQHQRLLNGPHANHHMPVVWPEVAEHRPASIRIARFILELAALATIVVATIIAFRVF